MEASKNSGQLVGGTLQNVVRPEELFERCVKIFCESDGLWVARCRLGLWSVDAHVEEFVRREAWRYWSHYYNDGEYDKLLSNPSHQPRRTSCGVGLDGVVGTPNQKGEA